ncbi:hypothetical protein Fmac_013212 [Flemingia macrophylla]|uniref:Uncharacterized protein n=1 Tax=Flemingia macrophylla TaxID=520843 RepID=A0ABD1MSI0_9FABA
MFSAYAILFSVSMHVSPSPVIWGKFSMVDAERRLLANALQDPDNHQFVLLSDSCVPLYHFNYIYDYLMYTNISFVDCFKDLGPHDNGRYSYHMLPEVECAKGLSIAMAEKHNLKNPAVKRILQEVKEMQLNPSDDYMSLHLRDFHPHARVDSLGLRMGFGFVFAFQCV